MSEELLVGLVALGLLVGLALTLTGETAGPPAQPPPLGAVLTNVSYGPYLLNFYAPTAQTGTPWPCIIFVHGGFTSVAPSTAFLTNQGSGDALISAGLLAAGYAIASLGFALAEPAQAQDVRLAVRYLRANAASFGIDPTRIGAWGESLGGWRVGSLGTVSDAVSAQQGWIAGGYQNESNEVSCVAGFYGPYDLNTTLAESATPSEVIKALDTLFGTTYTTAELTQYSATTYVSATAPPFLIVQGDDDELVPPVNATEMQGLLLGAGVPVTLIQVANAGHGLVQSGPGPLNPSLESIAASTVAFFQANL